MDWADFLAPICGTVLGCAGIIWGVVGIFGGLSKWSHESEYMAGIIRAKWFSGMCNVKSAIFDIHESKNRFFLSQ